MTYNETIAEHDYIAPITAHKIRQLSQRVTKSEARVAQFILLNLHRIGYETGASIAEKAAVSQITVSRFLKKAGYKGIAALKAEVQKEQLPLDGSEGRRQDQEIHSQYAAQMQRDAESLVSLYKQFGTPAWERLVDCVFEANRVYVTGFQAIRGAAEDLYRHLALARNDVYYLSPHDGMLAELLPSKKPQSDEKITIILIDIAPYAADNQTLCKLTKELGIELVVISDEFCHWTKLYTEHVIYARCQTGLFAESSWGVVLAANALVNAIAQRDPEHSAERYRVWGERTKALNLFW
ncbi:MurR/RpiR family transcriptional regulator [Neptuniibacter halophilus]|uniref:MurR/RpiR family transcriptional regulator n=1 Tax=Neptuniibacter halophilus TaxID=651666 RepID=UPI002573467B|nr:MurR/RpiR family transcriptional regulator [Neptuniibacter halophilus]